jgi:hypothetical protein
MAKLTKESRDALPADDFAVPGKRDLPIHDATHVKMAWDMVSKTKDLTPAERKEARRRIIERAKTHGIDTKDWESGKLKASVTLNAMALNIANDDHPNKMPFKGVMTRIGEPSDAPPEGSGGRLITISAEAAERGLNSLLGMAVDYKPNLDGHNPKAKIGIITAATIDGNAINIEGFIYANDFPDVAAEIKASKEVLGFSYEARDLYTNDPDANPVVITDCVFTGAAILLKSKAAYHSTSIQAAAERELVMDKDVEKMFADLAAGQATLAEGLAKITESMTKLGPVQAANLLPKIEPHAAKLESCAAEMEAAGIGGDPNNGHAMQLRKMAGHIRAEAAQGRIPSAWHGQVYSAAAVVPPPAVDTEATAKAIAAAVKPFADQVAAMGTKVADLTAAAAKNATPPERKTLTPAVTALLAKTGLDVPNTEGGKIGLAALNAALDKMSMSTMERMTLKTSLSRAGLLEGDTLNAG